jgi:hypothetical protein
MKAAALILLALTSVSAFAQAKVTIAIKPVKDAIVKHKTELRLAVMGTEAVLTATAERTTKVVDGAKFESTVVMKDFKLDVNGSDPGLQVDDTKIVETTDGTVFSLTGGIQGSDNLRSFLGQHFIAPRAEIAEGEEYTIEFAEQKEGQVPAFKVVGKYIGAAEAAGKKGHKFTLKLTEPGEGGFTSESTFVVLEDGTILSAEGKFKNLPIPAVGQSVEGSYKLAIVG